MMPRIVYDSLRTISNGIHFLVRWFACNLYYVYLQLCFLKFKQSLNTKPASLQLGNACVHPHTHQSKTLIFHISFSLAYKWTRLIKFIFYPLHILESKSWPCFLTVKKNQARSRINRTSKQPSFLKARLAQEEIASIWSKSRGTGPSGSSAAKYGSGRKIFPIGFAHGTLLESPPA